MSSQVWKHFKVDVGNTNKAVCNLCDVSNPSRVIQRGKTPKQYSTKPLWNHLKNTHKSYHDKLVKTHPRVSDCEADDEDDPQAEGSSTGQSSQSQPTLSQFMSQKKAWDPNSAQSKKITRIIGRTFKSIYFLHSNKIINNCSYVVS